MDGIIIPKMLVGGELVSALTNLPSYDESIHEKDAATRLNALSDLFDIYIPSRMSVEIYTKLYLSLVRSLSKKGTKTDTQQQNANHRIISGGTYSGEIIGSNSFSSYTILGKSGIGKTSSINRAISIIGNQVIETKNPYSKISPFLLVECPFDCSYKQFLLSVLKAVDDAVGSTYYKNAIRAKMTTDVMIASVSNVLINHLGGVLIVDEFTNVVNNKNGQRLVNMLKQLLNSCKSISICMVGLPECSTFFEQEFQMARRSVGLCYDGLDFDVEFFSFCEKVFSYQYVKQKTKLSSDIVNWLYEHSGGVVSVVITLIHDAQEIAILSGKETLSIETLNLAYKDRVSMLHSYIHPDTLKRKPQIYRNVRIPEQEQKGTLIEKSIVEIISEAKNAGDDILQALKEMFVVEEVDV